MYLGHKACWVKRFDINQVRPMMTLDQLIEKSNQRDKQYLSKAAKLNWLVDNLRTHPLRKPLILNGNYSTIMGDSRVIAFKLLGITHAPAVVFKFKFKETDVIIKDEIEFKHLAGFDDSASIRYEPAGADPFAGDKFEALHINDADSAHHLENWSLRDILITNYLKKHPDIVFDENWFLHPIDWERYSH